jgi:hypothetical protein
LSLRKLLYALFCIWNWRRGDPVDRSKHVSSSPTLESGEQTAWGQSLSGRRARYVRQSCEKQAEGENRQLGLHTRMAQAIVLATARHLSAPFNPRAESPWGGHEQFRNTSFGGIEHPKAGLSFCSVPDLG